MIVNPTASRIVRPRWEGRERGLQSNRLLAPVSANAMEDWRRRLSLSEGDMPKARLILLPLALVLSLPLSLSLSLSLQDTM